MKVFCETCRAQGKVELTSYWVKEAKTIAVPCRTTMIMEFYYKNGNYRKAFPELPEGDSLTAYWPACGLNGLQRTRIKTQTCPDCKGKRVVDKKEKEKYEPDYSI
jgi:hypothetical protein